MRTTREAVQNILGGHWDGTTDVEPFMETATNMTDWVSTKDTASVLSSTSLELIERYLAAHFYVQADQMFASKSTGGASGGFQGQTAMVLNYSPYGQHAMLLDVTGVLAQRNQEVQGGGLHKATCTWLGKPVSDQTDYEDRD